MPLCLRSYNCIEISDMYKLQTNCTDGTTSSRWLKPQTQIISYTNPHNNHGIESHPDYQSIKCNIVTIGAVTTQPENQQNLHDKLPLILQSSLTALSLLPSHLHPLLSVPHQTHTKTERERARERERDSCSPALQNTQNEQAHTLPHTHTHLSCGCCIHK